MTVLEISYCVTTVLFVLNMCREYRQMIKMNRLNYLKTLTYLEPKLNLECNSFEKVVKRLDFFYSAFSFDSIFKTLSIATLS
jgi:hypothetical protein